jgi:hypothetical protein
MEPVCLYAVGTGCINILLMKFKLQIIKTSQLAGFVLRYSDISAREK